MKVLLTGANGFLGWHTRCRLHALTEYEVTVATRSNWADLPTLVAEADAIIHIAGINRAEPAEVAQGNSRLAQDLVSAMQAMGSQARVVFANSIQAGNATPYGDGKAAAAMILREAAEREGGVFTDVLLPNLFGEHGQPNYNSFTATFIEKRLRGEAPSIEDRSINLLHVQDAAQALIDGLEGAGITTVEPQGHTTSVQEVWDKICLFSDLYATGEMPPFPTKFDVDLFNTYRAATFPEHCPIPLDPKEDPRGRLVETIRSHGGQGQAFVSTTKPGITRGDHYHLSKIERFAVLQGTARIALRRMYSHEVLEFHVDGDHPVAIDMPTMWTHNITNTGDDVVITQFWTNELFDPQNPDTFWVKVDSEECSV